MSGLYILLFILCNRWNYYFIILIWIELNMCFLFTREFLLFISLANLMKGFAIKPARCFTIITLTRVWFEKKRNCSNFAIRSVDIEAQKEKLKSIWFLLDRKFRCELLFCLLTSFVSINSLKPLKWQAQFRCSFHIL